MLMVETITEQLRPLLQNAGLKATAERVAILNVLQKSPKPLSVKEIKEALQKPKQPAKVDQATIYRNMDSLVKGDLIRLVNFRHDHNHYEIVDNSHHHHLICESCGKVVDVSKCDTTKIEQQVKKLGDFAVINSHALEFFGLCKKCAK